MLPATSHRNDMLTYCGSYNEKQNKALLMLHILTSAGAPVWACEEDIDVAVVRTVYSSFILLSHLFMFRQK